MANTDVKLTPHQVLATARMIATKRAPYFQAGISQLVPREMPGLGTFASTKNWIMLWDPKTAVEWGVDKVAAVIIHELWHLLHDHHERFSAPSINLDIANIAEDLSINPGIMTMGFELPEGCLYPQRFQLADNLTAEEYYAKLMKMDIKYEYYSAEDGSELNEDGSPKETTSTNHDGTKVKVRGCGSCSARPIPGEPEDDDGEGRSKSEARRTRITIAKMIKQQGRGSVPAGLVRWADDMMVAPKIRWEDKLKRACRAAVAYRAGSGYNTYVKFSRKQAGIGFGTGKPVLPSVRAKKPRVTFLIDTSGSMSEHQLSLAMGEAQGVFNACGASLDVVVCDAAVHGAKSVRSIKEACGMLKGGGGSDFRPAFDHIMSMKPKNDIIVAATDGDITVPDVEPPGVKVIWLLINSNRAPAKWGVVVEVN